MQSLSVMVTPKARERVGYQSIVVTDMFQVTEKLWPYPVVPDDPMSVVMVTTPSSRRPAAQESNGDHQGMEDLLRVRFLASPLTQRGAHTCTGFSLKGVALRQSKRYSTQTPVFSWGGEALPLGSCRRSWTQELRGVDIRGGASWKGSWSLCFERRVVQRRVTNAKIARPSTGVVADLRELMLE